MRTAICRAGESTSLPGPHCAGLLEEGWRARACKEKWLASRQSGRKKAGWLAQVTSSRGEPRRRETGGPRAHPRWKEHFEWAGQRSEGLPARTKAAASREVTGDLGVAVEAVGIHPALWDYPRSRSGRARRGHRTQRGPQPPPHPTHRNSFRSRYRSGSGGPPEACARASKAGERERRAVRGQHSRTSSGGSGGRGWRAPERFRSKEAAAGPACGHTVPTRHCGPEAGAERAHSGLGDTVCPNRSAAGSGMADRTAPGEPRAWARPDKARRAGRSE